MPKDDEWDAPPFDPGYAQSLLVRGIKCFNLEGQTLNLTDDSGRWSKWTLILGDNGTGKSTLLQLVAVLLNEGVSLPHRSRRFDSAAICDGVSAPIQAFESQTFREVLESFTADRNSINDPQSPLSQAAVSQLDLFIESSCSEGREVEIANFWFRTPGGSWVYSSRVMESKDGKYEKSEIWHKVNMLVVGYGAWRTPGKSTLGDGERMSDPCNHLFSPASDLIDAEEWLLRRDYAVAKDQTSSPKKSQLNAVKSILKKLLPDVKSIRIDSIGEGKGSFRVLFETHYGEVLLSQLGYGYQSMITWIVDFAARMYHKYPGSPNPLAEPAICLIDEIDLHLHPSWQRKLMSFLSERFPKTQFIATAHSPLIVQAAEEIGANVVVLRREGDHVVIDNDPISVKGWRVDQILSSELFKDTPLRDAESEKWMARRVALLKKDKLTVKEKRELDELNAKVRELPTGSSADERNLDRRLKAAVELLEKAAKAKK